MSANAIPTINEAIVQYLGYQRGFSFPQRSELQIRAACGEGADEILAVIENCLNDLGMFETRWDSESVDEACSRLRSELRMKQPWLSELGLAALVWKFTYDWK